MARPIKETPILFGEDARRFEERMLHPDEQKQIIAVFLKHGIENKPEFDQYIDLFDW